MPKLSALANVTIGLVKSADPVVVNVVVALAAASALFATSFTPDEPPTTTNEYPVAVESGAVGTKLAERLFGLYDTEPATAVLPVVVTSVIVVVAIVDEFMSLENPAVITGASATPVEPVTGETPRIVGEVLSGVPVLK